MTALYLIALGSNMRHPDYGGPRHVLHAALDRIASEPQIGVAAVSPIISSAPIGPSQRRFANGAAIVDTDLDPPALLALLQQVESEFGRRKIGQRWRARVLDLDIVMWSGGLWRGERLTIPHPEFRNRDFVLGPARAIAGDWRDPVTNLTVNQLDARLTRKPALPR